MTSESAHSNAVPAPGRRFSTAALVGAGLVGLVVGAIAAFAVTGLVFTVRVPPPYPPPFSSTPPPGFPAPPCPPANAGVASGLAHAAIAARPAGPRWSRRRRG